MDDKELKIIEEFTKFKSAFHLSKALLDDYAEQMSKLTNEDKQVIIDRIREKAELSFKDSNPSY